MAKNLSEAEIEKFSKEFSLKLADKLERKEISLSEMAGYIDRFMILLSESKEDKLRSIVDKL